MRSPDNDLMNSDGDPEERTNAIAREMGKSSLTALVALARINLIAPLKLADFLFEIGFFTRPMTELIAFRFLSCLGVVLPAQIPMEFAMYGEAGSNTQCSKWKCTWDDIWVFTVIYPEIWDRFFSDPARVEAFFLMQTNPVTNARLMMIASRMQQARPELYRRLGESHPFFGAFRESKVEADIQRGKQLVAQGLRMAQRGQLEKAISVLDGSCDYFPLNSKLRRGRIFSNLAAISLKLKRPAQALEYVMLALLLLGADIKTLKRYAESVKALCGDDDFRYERHAKRGFFLSVQYDLSRLVSSPSGVALMKQTAMANFEKRILDRYGVEEPDCEDEDEEREILERIGRFGCGKPLPFVGKSAFWLTRRLEKNKTGDE